MAVVLPEPLGPRSPKISPSLGKCQMYLFSYDKCHLFAKSLKLGSSSVILIPYQEVANHHELYYGPMSVAAV